MNFFLNKYGYLALFCLATWPLFAQQELGLLFMDESWQLNKLNPAHYPSNSNVYVGLPGVYNNTFLSALKLSDYETNNGQGETVLDMNPFIGDLDPENEFRQYINIETISVGLTAGPVKLSLGHSLIVNSFMQYPKTLAQLIWQGNAQFIGEEVSFGPDILAMGYQELALGLGMEVIPNLEVGIRAKYLNGFGSLYTERSDLVLFTDPDSYQLTLNSDFLFHSNNFITSSGLWEYDIDFDQGGGNESFFTANSGFAIDFGFKATVGKFRLAASVLDLGTINWKSNPNNFSLTGSRTYEGLDALDEVIEDNTSIGSAIDTLKLIYEPQETQEEFTTDLPLRAYGSLIYEISPVWTAGAGVYVERYAEQWFPAASVSANARFVPWLQVGLAYNYRNNTYSNIGLNTHFLLGNVQVVAATDNLLSLSGNQYDLAFRVGINLAFGQPKAEHYNDVDDQDAFFEE